MEAENKNGVNRGPRDFLSVLTEARDIAGGARNDDYGRPVINHSRTAALWSAYLGTEVSAADVCALNILQKLSREKHRPKRDNRVDIAGYAANLDDCQLPDDFTKRTVDKVRKELD